MRGTFARHHYSHSQLLKEQMTTTQINVATEVFQKCFGQERCSSRHHVHTQYSIDTCNSNRKYDHSPGFQCLIVTKTEIHGLFELNLLCVCKPHFSVSTRSHFSKVFCPIKKREQLLPTTPAQCNMAYSVSSKVDKELKCCFFSISCHLFSFDWALICPVSFLTTDATACA